jgi:hypothetical protein
MIRWSPHMVHSPLVSTEHSGNIVVTVDNFNNRFSLNLLAFIREFD